MLTPQSPLSNMSSDMPLVLPTPLLDVPRTMPTTTTTTPKPDATTLDSYPLEDVDHFTTSLIADCIKRDGQGLCNLFMSKHFDDDHPQNNTIEKLTAILNKGDRMRVFDGHHWVSRLTIVVTEEMLEWFRSNAPTWVASGTDASLLTPKEVSSFVDNIGLSIGLKLPGDGSVYDDEDEMDHQGDADLPKDHLVHKLLIPAICHQPHAKCNSNEDGDRSAQIPI